MKRKISEEFYELLNQDIIPHIYTMVESTDTACINNERITNLKFCDNYNSGTWGYGVLQQLLNHHLKQNNYFKFSASKRAIYLTYQNGMESFSFTISRVDAQSRIPTSQRKIKNSLNDQFLLSNEIADIILSKGELLLGYDYSEEAGLGKITFGELKSTGRRDNFYFDPIHCFSENTSYNIIDAPSLEVFASIPEDSKIIKPQVKKLAKL